MTENTHSDEPADEFNDSDIPDFEDNPEQHLEAIGKSIDGVTDTSDDALATGFVDDVKNDIRHVGQWNKWMEFTDGCWQIDHSMVAYHRSRKYLRSTARTLSNKLYDMRLKSLPEKPDDDKKKKLKRGAISKTKAMRSAKTIHNVATLAKSDPRIALSVDQLDSDPWLLNTPSGTIDLHTGDVRKHNPKDYITKKTAAGPGLGKPTIWLEFLSTIMKGDESMVAYLQKVFGYCLVGETKEHEMYFGYGTGANGKGVTLNTMRDLLGDYGVEASIETFIVNPNQRHPTELADLRGARLVTCGETDEGQRWAEARIKMLTGGDPVKARFMRQDFFQYRPQFKLFLAGNHKPKLTNVDEAIERRFRLIPFTYTVPKADRDVDLGQKLRTEWPQILHWCIEGCLAWQREGLSPPEAVSKATRGYLNQEDALLAWYTECCEPVENGFAYVKDIFASWRDWAQENGEPIGTKRTLTMNLEDREPIWKIFKGKRNEGFGFRGMNMRSKPEPETPIAD